MTVVMGWASLSVISILSYSTTPTPISTMHGLMTNDFVWEVVDAGGSCCLGHLQSYMTSLIRFFFVCFVWFHQSCASFNCSLSNCNSRSVFFLPCFTILVFSVIISHMYFPIVMWHIHQDWNPICFSFDIWREPSHHSLPSPTSFPFLLDLFPFYLFADLLQKLFW